MLIAILMTTIIVLSIKKEGKEVQTEENKSPEKLSMAIKILYFF